MPERRERRIMHKVLELPLWWALGLYLVADIVAVAMGMGVPIFCIVLGLPVGWWVGSRLAAQPPSWKSLLDRVLLWAAATSAVTCLFMAILWGPCILKLRLPESELADFGIPMILYRPRASLIGWLVLMIVVSPFLQFLVTLFGAHLGLRWGMPLAAKGGPPEGGR
jgi:hypothetical protein